MPSVGPHSSNSVVYRAWLRPFANTHARRFVEAAAAALVVTASFLAPKLAHAQDKPAKYKPMTDFRLSRASQAEKFAAAARQKAAGGDCKGALDLFDQALRTSLDPQVTRDRGKCHDKEGNVRPAIDDYRAYLAARPDAPDTDAINERLLTLDAEYAASTEKKRDPFAATSAGAATVRAGDKKDPADPDGERPRNYDNEVSSAEKTDEAYSSSLRRGKGGALGFQLGYRSLVGSKSAKLGGYLVGLSGRYAFSEKVSGIAELAYGAYGNSGAITHFPVVIGFLGAEGRFPLDAFASHQLFAAGGLGIEHSVGETVNAVTFYGIPRARVGYRYLIASTVGVEAGFDAGLYYTRAVTSSSSSSVSTPSGTVTTSTTTSEGRFFGSVGVLGGLVVGF